MVDLHDFGDTAAVGIGDIVGMKTEGVLITPESARDMAGKDSSDNIEIGWFGVGGWRGVGEVDHKVLRRMDRESHLVTRMGGRLRGEHSIEGRTGVVRC